MTIELRRAILLACAVAAIAAAASVVVLRPTHAGPVTIAVGDQWFCDSSFQGGVCETEIQAGTTVVWDTAGASLPHTTRECGASCDAPTDSPLWDSDLLTDGETFQFTFDTPGEYLYLCEVHPINMRGRIVVAGAPATATATNTPSTATDVPPSPTATETPVGDTPPPPTATSTPTEPAGVVGDANGDDAVDAIDSALVLQLVAGLVASLPSTADANVDGTTNAIDSALILQFVAGLIGQLPP